jgi:hypothetical protein
MLIDFQKTVFLNKILTILPLIGLPKKGKDAAKFGLFFFNKKIK